MPPLHCATVPLLLMPAPLTKFPDALATLRRTAFIARVLMVALFFASLGFAAISRSWWVFFAFMLPVLPVALVWEVARRRGIATARAAIETHGMTCLGCAFNLAGLPPRAQCPECGLWNDAERTAVIWSVALVAIKGERVDSMPPPPNTSDTAWQIELEPVRRARHRRAWLVGCSALFAFFAMAGAVLAMTWRNEGLRGLWLMLFVVSPLILVLLAGPTIIRAGSVGGPSVVADVWNSLVYLFSVLVSVLTFFAVVFLLITAI
jgi:hypothetical protein